jgi:hypothetical protein
MQNRSSPNISEFCGNSCCKECAKKKRVMPAADKDDAKYQICQKCSSKLYIKKLRDKNNIDVDLKRKEIEQLKGQLRNITDEEKGVDKEIETIQELINNKKMNKDRKLLEGDESNKILIPEKEAILKEVENLRKENQSLLVKHDDLGKESDVLRVKMDELYVIKIFTNVLIVKSKRRNRNQKSKP